MSVFAKFVTNVLRNGNTLAILSLSMKIPIDNVPLLVLSVKIPTDNLPLLVLVYTIYYFVLETATSSIC